MKMSILSMMSLVVITAMAMTAQGHDVPNSPKATAKDVKCSVAVPVKVGGPTQVSDWKNLTGSPNSLGGNNFLDQVSRGKINYVVRASVQEVVDSNGDIMIDYSVSRNGKTLSIAQAGFRSYMIVYADEGKVILKCLIEE